MDQTIHDFLVETLHLAGQTDLPKDIEEVLVQDLYTRLEDRLVLTASQHLTDSQQQELLDMPDDQKTGEFMTEYLKKNIANYEEVIAQAMLDFQNVYVEASRADQ